MAAVACISQDAYRTPGIPTNTKDSTCIICAQMLTTANALLKPTLTCSFRKQLDCVENVSAQVVTAVPDAQLDEYARNCRWRTRTTQCHAREERSAIDSMFEGKFTSSKREMSSSTSSGFCSRRLSSVLQRRWKVDSECHGACRCLGSSSAVYACAA